MFTGEPLKLVFLGLPSQTEQTPQTVLLQFLARRESQATAILSAEWGTVRGLPHSAGSGHVVCQSTFGQGTPSLDCIRYSTHTEGALLTLLPL